MKNQRSWKSVFTLVFFLLVLHLPFVFSTSRPIITESSIVSGSVTSKKISIVSKNVLFAQSVYEHTDLNEKGLSWEAFNYAMKGREYLINKGLLNKEDILTIVDFTKPSTEKRMYVVDISSETVLFHTYVAHGQKSGMKVADKFSNIPESLQSSLGFFQTLGTYNGKHGFSMKLSGVENGINDKAESRAIVMHSAAYVSEGFIKSQGYLGRSWGCPALPEKLNKPIIETIKNGSCLFIYSKDKNYLQQSKIINS